MSLADMAMGYGSEFHLLRLLGHHRNYLNNRIQKVLGTQEEIQWLDYPSTDASFDKEWKGIECFQGHERYEELKIAWNAFWPQTGSAQTWDAIFTVDGKWFFVESKAHKAQTKASCSRTSEESRKKIHAAFTQVGNSYGSSSVDYWMTPQCDSYQLANRLAFIYFCKKQGIDAALLYINFINGFDKLGTQGKMNVSSETQWDEIWQHHFQSLGIQREAVRKIWFSMCIDCTTEFTTL